MITPLISVIMPVYNAEEYLREAIESVLNQTFTDFEFFIIDDASDDKSVKIIKSYSDDRIILIEKNENTGYTDSLNLAISLSKGKYIARMDADDISFINRFYKQFNYLEQHQDVLALGTLFKIVGSEIINKPPILYDQVKIYSLMHCPIAHPTVFIRRVVFNLYSLKYNKDFQPAEDFDLWTRIIEIGKVENLPVVLLQYRVHASQISQIYNNKQAEATNIIRKRQLNKILNFEQKPYDAEFAVKVLSKQEVVFSEIKSLIVKQILSDFIYLNSVQKIYNEKFLFFFLQDVWITYLNNRKTFHISDIKVLIPYKYFKPLKMGFLFNIKFVLKSLFKF